MFANMFGPRKRVKLYHESIKFKDVNPGEFVTHTEDGLQILHKEDEEEVEPCVGCPPSLPDCYQDDGDWVQKHEVVSRYIQSVPIPIVSHAGRFALRYEVTSEGISYDTIQKILPIECAIFINTSSLYINIY